jgi:hydroxymethylpyrimidine pyrophosphatase-like HAD family hydrolase
MYFLALATDYDGTIAHHGVVDEPTLAALERFKKTGRRLILVTGRELPDLKRVFPQFDLFDLLVVENGALLYDPATQKEHCIAPPPPPAFVEELRKRGVTPLSVGRSIVATWEPHERTVIDVIRDMGLDLQIIFNKGAVMVLPGGMNKAAGLKAGLKRLDLAEPNVVGVGDAENDHAFLLSCGCAAAVANALPTVKDECDVRLANHHGAGVVELVDLILREDARIVAPKRHGLLVGHDREGHEALPRASPRHRAHSPAARESASRRSRRRSPSAWWKSRWSSASSIPKATTPSSTGRCRWGMRRRHPSSTKPSISFESFPPTSS